MKFVCLKCEVAMKLGEVTDDTRGSLGIRFSCPHCGHEIAMLTNPMETQLVGSLGVKIGPRNPDQTAADAGDNSASEVGSSSSAGESPCAWTSGALARLQRIPEFVRPMAKSGIERFAQDNGYSEINEQVLDLAKDRFGM